MPNMPRSLADFFFILKKQYGPANSSEEEDRRE
jgi:hypothetical protein